MSMRYQAGVLTASYFPLKVPDAPTIGTATAGSANASVSFTAPSNVGGGAITGYTVTSSPGNFTATGASSPITVSGLTVGTAYTFTVVATNAFGTGPRSAASNSATPVVQGQQEYTSPGTYSWVAPSGVTSVSAVVVGGGGEGWGGAAGPGGTQSSFVNTSTVRAFGGGAPASASTVGVGGSGGTGDGGGNGGNGSLRASGFNSGGGGGGAGGYSGAGGNASNTSPASSGSGGGGGGGVSPTSTGDGGGGGGVGILGQGSDGAGGTTSSNFNTNGKGGSGGGSGGYTGQGAFGGAYGGGAGGFSSGAGGGGGELRYKNNISVTPGASYAVVVGTGSASQGYSGGNGAVRIIWPGTTRQFPSTNTGNL